MSADPERAFEAASAEHASFKSAKVVLYKYVLADQKRTTTFASMAADMDWLRSCSNF